MIRSMTGFGRSEFQLDQARFEVELRSVNHRHLDLRVKLPRLLSGRDSLIKGRVQARLGRGKVDCTVSLAGAEQLPGLLLVDTEVANQYVDAARNLGAEHGIPGELDASTLLGMPGVVRFVEHEIEAERLEASLIEAVDRALDALEAMRLEEGEALAQAFEVRLQVVDGLLDSFESRAEQVVQAARERLRKRSEQIRQETGLVDDARLYQEIVIAADRLDITEELVRLRSHVAQFRTILADASSEPVGRRLEFLMQELGREANTVGSKANDADLAQQVVDLKTELERIREQVQNIE
jgi:uncharacterized protein (TIGR00255 family)